MSPQATFVFSPERKRAQRAFTVMELLAAVGVVVLLAALVVPKINGMTQKAGNAQCMANLRQLYVAVRNYAQDYDNRIVYGRGYKVAPPRTFDWTAELALKGYLGAEEAPPGTNEATYPSRFKVLTCPVHLARKKDATGTPATQSYTYGFNTQLTNAEKSDGTKTFTMLSEPSKTIMIGDGSLANNSITIYISSSLLPQGVHDGKANLLFCDGHVEAVRPQDLPSSNTPEGKVAWTGAY